MKYDQIFTRRIIGVQERLAQRPGTRVVCVGNLQFIGNDPHDEGARAGIAAVIYRNASDRVRADRKDRSRRWRTGDGWIRSTIIGGYRRRVMHDGATRIPWQFRGGKGRWTGNLRRNAILDRAGLTASIRAPIGVGDGQRYGEIASTHAAGADLEVLKRSRTGDEAVPADRPGISGHSS